MILEAGCGGGFWRRILGCGLQRKVLEAGSGGVTMDGRPWHLTGARPEPGYPRGDRKADLKSCTRARASKTVNPIADVFGLVPRRPPPPPPTAAGAGETRAARGPARRSVFPLSAGRRLPGATAFPRGSAGAGGRGLAAEPPPSHPGWPRLLSVGVPAAADWAAESFARSAPSAPPLQPTGPPPPPPPG